jgi:LmbE family N-acetylglucosaminyl deacetylase
MMTFVCCATRGEAGEPRPGSGVEPDELPQIREAELRTAAALLGVTGVEVLEWRDSGMDGEATRGSLVGASLADVAVSIATCIEAVDPDVVVTLDASDGHRDHAVVRDATIAAVESGSRARALYLLCLRRSLMRRWAQHMASAKADSVYLSLGELGTPDEEITTLLDSSAFEARRWAAIQLHRSQASPFDDLPDDLRHAFLGSDALRRVFPPWTGGPVETRLAVAAG